MYYIYTVYCIITDALVLLTHDLQSSIDKPAELRIVWRDFSFVFVSANHQGLLYKLKILDVGGPLLNIVKNVFRLMKTSVNLNLRTLMYIKAVFYVRYFLTYILLICRKILKIKLFCMQMTPFFMLKSHLPLIVQY